MKDCSSGEMKEWGTTFTVEDREYDIKFAQLSDLKMEVCVDAYNKDTAKDISGQWEAEFHRALTEELDGFAPLSIELDIHGIKFTNEQLLESNVAITNQEDEVCFLAFIEFDDPVARNDYDIALFHSDEYGNTQWILPFGSWHRGDRWHFEFFIPRPTSIERNDQVGKFGNPGKQMIRLVGWRTSLPEDYFEQKLTNQKKYDLFHVRRRTEGDWYFESIVDMRRSDEIERWKHFDHQKGKTLLLIHGTHGTASHAFGDLLTDGPMMEELHKKYGDRILAFNHPTLLKGVEHNGKRLRKFLKGADHIQLDLDILTRSRGALVARYLLEQKRLPAHVKVNDANKFVMLFAPNQGTPSSDWDNVVRVLKINSWLNQLTEFIRLTLDDNDRKDILYEIARIRAELQSKKDALFDFHIFQGVVDQQPGSKFLKKLNKANSSPIPKEKLPTYYVLGAVFDPENEDIPIGKARRKRLAKSLRKIFNGQPNDGIISVESALMQWEEYDQSPNFRLEEGNYKILTKSVNTHHNNYPTDRSIRAAIKHFLLDDGKS